MYRVPKKVPEFEKFDMVFGGKLFSSHNGRPALPVRVALGALIIERAAEEKKEDDDADSPEGGSGGTNKGTLMVDATCAPQDMRFPQDVSLVDEGE